MGTTGPDRFDRSFFFLADFPDGGADVVVPRLVVSFRGPRDVVWGGVPATRARAHNAFNAEDFLDDRWDAPGEVSV